MQITKKQNKTNHKTSDMELIIKQRQMRVTKTEMTYGRKTELDGLTVNRKECKLPNWSYRKSFICPSNWDSTPTPIELGLIKNNDSLLVSFKNYLKPQLPQNSQAIL